MHTLDAELDVVGQVLKELGEHDEVPSGLGRGTLAERQHAVRLGSHQGWIDEPVSTTRVRLQGTTMGKRKWKGSA